MPSRAVAISSALSRGEPHLLVCHRPRARLEELRMFLENETWELCPVKSNFNIAQLHEFKFMGQCRSPSVSPSRQAASSAAAPTQEELSLFQQYVQEGNPFEMHIEHKEEETEDVLASNGYESDELEKSVYQDYDSDSDVPEELKQDYVDEQTGDAPLKSVSRETTRSKKKSDYNLNKTNAPILTNTTLNVIGGWWKGHIQMMNILKPIALMSSLRVNSLTTTCMLYHLLWAQ
ncbi:syndetin [Lates japonicus]|uniref:Syndetin n=1 Tax=Lates japonicus TaxID=270547 RepID=A0AAD3NG37_LATJO|nr:syndetin [Lates japonicus]